MAKQPKAMSAIEVMFFRCCFGCAERDDAFSTSSAIWEGCVYAKEEIEFKYIFIC